MVEFSERLRALRKQKNLTQKQLAAMIGVKNSIISFYEVGDRFPSPEILIKLSRVFGVSTDYLLGLSTNETIDVSGLEDEDKLLLHAIANRLRNKTVHI